MSLCLELNLVHVVDPFVARVTTSGLIYFRLHGGRNFKQVFTDAELHRVARDLSAPRRGLLGAAHTDRIRITNAVVALEQARELSQAGEEPLP